MHKEITSSELDASDWNTSGIHYPDDDGEAQERLAFVATFYRGWRGTAFRVLRCERDGVSGAIPYWRGFRETPYGSGIRLTRVMVMGFCPTTERNKDLRRNKRLAEMEGKPKKDMAGNAKRWRQGKIEGGLCSRCGKLKPRPGLKTCLGCGTRDAAQCRDRAIREEMKAAREEMRRNADGDGRRDGCPNSPPS